MSLLISFHNSQQSTGIDVEYIDSKFNMTATTNYSSQSEKCIDHVIQRDAANALKRFFNYWSICKILSSNWSNWSN